MVNDVTNVTAATNRMPPPRFRRILRRHDGHNLFVETRLAMPLISLAAATPTLGGNVKSRLSRHRHVWPVGGTSIQASVVGLLRS